MPRFKRLAGTLTLTLGPLVWASRKVRISINFLYINKREEGLAASGNIVITEWSSSSSIWRVVRSYCERAGRKVLPCAFLPLWAEGSDVRAMLNGTSPLHCVSCTSREFVRTRDAETLRGQHMRSLCGSVCLSPAHRGDCTALLSSPPLTGESVTHGSL